MMDTMTMQHQGRVPGGARVIAPAHRIAGLPSQRAWQFHVTAPAFRGCDTTGVAAFASDTYQGSTTNPAGVTGLTSMKRNARHLGTRST